MKKPRTVTRTRFDAMKAERDYYKQQLLEFIETSRHAIRENEEFRKQFEIFQKEFLTQHGAPEDRPGAPEDQPGA